jgi:hypothetical protein
MFHIGADTLVDLVIKKPEVDVLVPVTLYRGERARPVQANSRLLGSLSVCAKTPQRLQQRRFVPVGPCESGC